MELIILGKTIFSIIFMDLPFSMTEFFFDIWYFLLRPSTSLYSHKVRYNDKCKLWQISKWLGTPLHIMFGTCCCFLPPPSSHSYPSLLLGQFSLSFLPLHYSKTGHLDLLGHKSPWFQLGKWVRKGVPGWGDTSRRVQKGKKKSCTDAVLYSRLCYGEKIHSLVEAVV